MMAKKKTNRYNSSKQDWISQKINILENENKGRSHEQNQATAYSMFEQKHQNGGEQLPQYQNGKNKYYDYPSNTTNTNPWGNNQLAFNDPRMIPQVPTPNYNNLRLPSMYENTGNSTWKQPATNIPQVKQSPRPVASVTQSSAVVQTPATQQAVTPTTVATANQPAGQFSHSSQQVPQSIGYTPTATTYQAPTSAFDESTFTAGQDWAQGNPLPQMGGFQGFNYDPNTVDASNTPSSVLNGGVDNTTASQTNPAYERTPDYFSPYGGVDITSRLAYGANQLGRGNGAGAALGFGSAALGLTRVGLGAYAAGKRGKYVQDEYNTNMNKYQVPATQYAQDGGMIDFMQMGGQKPLTDTGVQNLNANKSFAGLEVTPEFGKSGYFVTEEQLRQQEAAKLAQEQMLRNQQMNNVVDVTSDGQFTNRKVWHTQKPEWFVGKQTPIEGKDFSTVPYKQWESYQQSPAYSNYLNQNNPQQPIADNRKYQQGGQIKNIYGEVLTGYEGEEPSDKVTSTGTYHDMLLNKDVPNFTTDKDIRFGVAAHDYTVPSNNKFAVIQAKNNEDYELLNNSGASPDLRVKKALEYYNEYGMMPQLNNLTVSQASPEVRQQYRDTDWNSHVKMQQGGSFANNMSTVGKSNMQTFNNLLTPSVNGLTSFLQPQGITYGTPEEQIQRQIYYPEVQSYESKMLNAQSTTDSDINKYYSDLNGDKLKALQLDQRPLPPNRFQDGGQQPQGQGVEQQVSKALSQGAQPEQILQQLIQSGMEQSEATALIQSVMQQLQGGQQQPMMEDGGQIVKKLTGEYTTDDSGNPLVNAEVEKNEFLQDPQGNVTKAVGATHEQGGVKTQLEAGTRIVSDHLKVGAELASHFKDTFGIEVKAKDTYAKVLDTFTKKSGLQKIVDEQEEIIEQLKKQEEIKQDSPASQSTVAFNKKFLGGKLKELEDEKTPLEEQRKALLDVVYNFQEASKPEETQEGHYQSGGEHPDPARWQDYLTQIRALGYKGSANVGDMQNWVAQNYPNNVVNYFTQSGQPMTAKHVDIVKNKFKDVFTKTGISPNKPSSSYTTEEKAQLQNALGENATKSFWLEGFKDNKKDWRFPLLSMNAGVQSISTPQTIQGAPLVGSSLPNFYQAPDAVPPAAQQQTQNATAQVKDNRPGQDIMLLPDQSGMFPNSLQGAAKITRRYDRVEAPQLTPDAQIQAINAQSQMAMNQLAQSPSNQTAVQISNLNNVTQQNVSKAVADTNRANIASDADAQYKNAQIQMAEENARAQDVQNYENKILKAQAVTDADVNNYYNHEQQAQLANYNAIQNLNLVNQMNENFAYNGNKVQRYGENPTFTLNPQQMIDYNKAATKKRTKNARFGGKI